ncbi:flotillin-2 [Octopus bimaculoides]|uniref:flotillin-2 n=1 Tax=Octopus bimaculoides TaxID=37653 RepID=UPI0022E8B911|nr:flotillin-2 [Octopus bimaculoides]
MGNIHTAGPDEALVISGGCWGPESKKTIVGNWGWAWWLVTDVQCISLEVMTLNPVCESVETLEGVPITVTGVAQCKIMKEKDLLNRACEQFLGKSIDHIERVVLQTLEGHLRAILGTLSVEAIYQDRDQFAMLVREVASPDVGRMGIEILSFTIKDIYDQVEYLASLGRTQTANVKRDADIGVAEAVRDAGIREAECEKVGMDAKYAADAKVADASRLFQMQKAAFDMEVNTKKAEAELAYELQGAKEKQKIRTEEIEIDVVERRKQIDVEEKEVIRKEKELVGTVKRPAEAQAFKVEMLAEGQRCNTEEYHRSITDEELWTFCLSPVAAEVSAPLSKTEEIVLLGDDKASGEVSRLISQLPPAVSALTGVDISKKFGLLSDRIPLLAQKS